MYRPPENTNRVKSIKSRFENVENNSISNKKNGPGGDLRAPFNLDKPNLARQLSDPSKRNIKRTPAFRIDLNSDKNLFQRNTTYNRSFYFDKVQSLKNNCDNNRNLIRTDSNEHPVTITKPILIKSKSSNDFALIRSKFDKVVQDSSGPNQRKNDTSLKKLSSLYTEPVSKALRNKTVVTPEKNDNDDIHNCKTLKIRDPSPPAALTDTLKAALKRPLPTGPAPQKPPRTFEHTPLKSADPPKNTSFLHHHVQSQDEIKNKKNERNERKHDPRYMLNKLEIALRNNKIKSRKPLKIEASTTSGEDSDDSVLFKSKSQRELPSIPDTPNSQHSFNFNCLNGLTNCNSTYETVKAPNSSFFIGRIDEPVYAEPFNFSQEVPRVKTDSGRDKKYKKSLYYMSTSLLGDEDCLNMDDNSNPPGVREGVTSRKDASHKEVSTDAENSSQSSFLSDLDSTASTPLDENNGIETTLKIKQLINTFEARTPSPSKKDTQKQSIDGSNRVEELKMSLQKTLDKCFDSCDEVDKEHKVSVDRIINKFQTYVKTMPKYRESRLSKDDRLFYCCLVVGWDREKPQIKLKFPEYVKIPDRIEDLCYPEAASGPLDITDNAQCYSLVITNDKGERTFGYCRRVIPEGSTKCIPLAYCILSKHRAPRFYKKILTELESRHGIPDKLRDELISAFYYNKFPRPGESIKIDLTRIIGDLDRFQDKSTDLNSFVHVTNGEYGTLNKKAPKYENMTFGDSDPVEDNGANELTLTLHHDTRYEEADLKPLHTLPPYILLRIFASLLLERKVILISCVISKLSCCVDALQSILYPFSWPHTFIPILPQCLWDVVESPTPVICGVLSVAVVNDHKIENGIVVDLDTGNIISEEGDEDSILSGCMKKAWNQGIALANTVPPEDYVHSVYLSDAYIKVFIVTLKHYKNHIVNKTFEKEAFIRNGKTKGIRRFLKWFTETTMFVSFIDSVISNPNSFTLFDNKIEMYGSDESNAILSKLLEWKKH